MIEDSEVLLFLQSIGSSDRVRRERAADEITDIYRALSRDQAGLIAGDLVAARLRETVLSCQEAQLNALCELKAWHQLPKEIFLSLLPLQESDLGTQKEYLEDLLDQSP